MQLDILGYLCKKCESISYPNRTRCRKCGHDQFDAVPLPKNGTLLTFTQLFTLPGDFEVGDICLGIVELENKVRITGQVKIPKPKTGMAVVGKTEVVRRDEYKEHHGMVFYAK